jgi:hypothetical protein
MVIIGDWLLLIMKSVLNRKGRKQMNDIHDKLRDAIRAALEMINDLEKINRYLADNCRRYRSRGGDTEVPQIITFFDRIGVKIRIKERDDGYYSWGEYVVSDDFNLVHELKVIDKMLIHELARAKTAEEYIAPFKEENDFLVKISNEKDREIADLKLKLSQAKQSEKIADAFAELVKIAKD